MDGAINKQLEEYVDSYINYNKDNRKSRGRKRPSTRFTADGNADRTRDFSDFGMNAKRGHISRIGVNLCD